MELIILVLVVCAAIIGLVFFVALLPILIPVAFIAVIAWIVSAVFGIGGGIAAVLVLLFIIACSNG